MRTTLLYFLCAFFSAGTYSAQLSLTVTSSTGSFSLTCNNPSMTLSASSGVTATTTYTWQYGSFVIAGPTLTVNNPGIYSVTASSGTESVTQTVQVVWAMYPVNLNVSLTSSTVTCIHPVTVTAFAPGSQFICYGPSVNGTVGSSFTVNAPGSYTLTGTHTLSGCTGSIVFGLSPGAMQPQFSGASNIFTVECPGTVVLSPAIVNGTANITYQWQVPPGVSGSALNQPTISTSVPGTYTVTATNTVSGCSTAYTLSVWSCTGLQADDWNNLAFFPNPVRDEIMWNNPVDRDVEVRIIAMDGVAIRQEKLSVGSVSVDVTSLKPGVYLLEIRSSDRRVTHPFIRE